MKELLMSYRDINAVISRHRNANHSNLDEERRPNEYSEQNEQEEMYLDGLYHGYFPEKAHASSLLWQRNHSYEWFTQSHLARALNASISYLETVSYTPSI